jgi:hypothetical protein
MAAEYGAVGGVLTVRRLRTIEAYYEGHRDECPISWVVRGAPLGHRMVAAFDWAAPLPDRSSFGPWEGLSP